MNAFRWTAFSLALALSAPTLASAAGSLIAPSALSASTRADYTSAIAAAKRADPEAFAALVRFEADVPAMDKSKRGRFAPMSGALRAFGDRGLWPMVEAVAFDGPSGADWTATAKTAWQAGLIEALGQLQDPRVIPLLDAVLASAPRDPTLLQSTVNARGAFGDDAGLDLLVRMAEAPGPHQAAVLAGLGQCRRARAAEVLASALDQTPAGGANVRSLVEALSDVGNAWVWPTLPEAQRAEATDSQRTAAEALVRAFVRMADADRTAISNALMVVDFADTPALVASVRSSAASDSLRSALDALLVRFARNPTR